MPMSAQSSLSHCTTVRPGIVAGSAAIGDHIRSHRGAERAVPLIDILNGALALIAARKIEIDVGPLASLFGKEALEQQIHLHRIDCGDSERVTHGAVRRRAAALN